MVPPYIIPYLLATCSSVPLRTMQARKTSDVRPSSKPIKFACEPRDSMFEVALFAQQAATQPAVAQLPSRCSGAPKRPHGTPKLLSRRTRVSDTGGQHTQQCVGWQGVRECAPGCWLAPSPRKATTEPPSHGHALLDV